MKIIFFLLSLVFAALTLVGAWYVVFTGGYANAGYAVVPLVLSIVFTTVHRNVRKRK